MAERTELIEAREKRGLSRAALAVAMGNASRHYIYHVEMGQRNPSMDFMMRWLKALGPDATVELFGGRLTMQPQVVWSAQDNAA
jgi:transcriptional regulator with XRE-family HTH domain